MIFSTSRLQAYVDGQCDEPERMEIEQTMQTNEELRQEVEQLQQSTDRIRQLFQTAYDPSVAPLDVEGLFTRITAQIPEYTEHAQELTQEHSTPLSESMTSQQSQKNKASREAPTPWWRWLFKPWLGGSLIAGAVALLVLLNYKHKPSSPCQGKSCWIVKGASLQMFLSRKKGSRLVRYEARQSQVLLDGDLIQFSYQLPLFHGKTGGKLYVAICVLDQKGQVSCLENDVFTLHKEQGWLPANHSVYWKSSTPQEKIFAVVSKKPFPLRKIRQELHSLFQKERRLHQVELASEPWVYTWSLLVHQAKK